MSALFELTAYGWVCKKVWRNSDTFKKPLVVTAAKSVFMNISTAPKHGFCRRPHTYL